MSNIVLSVNNVTKQYEKRVAVSNVTFDVKEGEIFGFIGANGAGKTTTMKMICGLVSITSGNITVGGFDVKTDYEKAMKITGGIIETPLMYTYMSGYDNLRYYASLYKGITSEKIKEISKIVGLEYRIDDKVKKYSLGMKQRLGIAQALLHTPKLLILDEPLSGLDPNGVKEMRDFLKRLARKLNIAILISSHMLSDMEQLCDTIGIIDNGVLVEIKPIEKIKESATKNNKIKVKVDYPNLAGKIIVNHLRMKSEVLGNFVLIQATENSIPEITKTLTNNNISIFGIEIEENNLEDVFLEIINAKKNNATSIL